MYRDTHRASKINGLEYLQGERLQDRRNPHITLKQWRAFHAVVNYGGFMDAAESLHLSQSTISYMLGKLQQQLGIPLLKLEGRKATLTDEGKMLLDRSRNLLKDAAELELYAESLRGGRAREVRVAVHRDFPTSHLTHALERMKRAGIDIQVALSQLTQRRLTEALQQRRADLAIASSAPPGFEAKALLEVEYSLVLHAGHELARASGPIRREDLGGHIQVVVVEDAEAHDDIFGARIESKRWTLSSLDAAVEVLASGTGYAWLPAHRLQSWIDRGVLVALKSGEPDMTRQFYLAYPRSVSASSTQQRLVDELLRLTYPPVDQEPASAAAAELAAGSMALARPSQGLLPGT